MPERSCAWNAHETRFLHPRAIGNVSAEEVTQLIRRNSKVIYHIEWNAGRYISLKA